MREKRDFIDIFKILDIYIFKQGCSFHYLDIIVIGTGDKVVKLDKEIHREMRKKRIALEVQDTVRAINKFAKDDKSRFHVLATITFGGSYFFL